MQTSAELKNLLQRIDHKGYSAYKDTRGSYEFPGYVLSIDHVQGDPFAAPSKVSVEVLQKIAGFPKTLFSESHRRIALQDHLIREFGKVMNGYMFQAKGSGKSGLIRVTNCGQEVLERTAADIREDGTVILRFEVGFPANGRTVNARELEKIFFQYLPSCVQETLYYKNLDIKKEKSNINNKLNYYFIFDFIGV